MGLTLGVELHEVDEASGVRTGEDETVDVIKHAVVEVATVCDSVHVVDAFATAKTEAKTRVTLISLYCDMVNGDNGLFL